MKKTTKAIYAGVAGLALLTTTGGTFALWTDTEPLPAATVTTGDLRLPDTASSVSWYRLTTNPFTNVRSVVAGVSQVRPGDVIVGVTSVAATIDGDTLAATLDASHTFNDANSWLGTSPRVVTLGGTVSNASVDQLPVVTGGQVVVSNVVGRPVVENLEPLSDSPTVSVVIEITVPLTGLPETGLSFGALDLELRQVLGGAHFTSEGL